MNPVEQQVLQSSINDSTLPLAQHLSVTLRLGLTMTKYDVPGAAPFGDTSPDAAPFGDTSPWNVAGDDGYGLPSMTLSITTTMAMTMVYRV